MEKKKCTRCKKDFSQKMKICPFCNMPSKMPFTKEKTICPKCKVELVPDVFRKVQLDVCPECAGLWLDTLDFEHLTSEKDVYTDPDTKTNFIQEVPNGGGRFYECVRCNNLMLKVNFKNISGVVMDVCGDHGVWLDKGELISIRNFISAGGLDKSQDLAIFRNKNKIKKIASQVNDVAFMQRMLHRWSLKRIILSGARIM